ncbi:MAG TPA: hypothetical protein ENJ09_06350 [Planctomycetes bacterium]|nr:hypothetical protein [Planctomycetota bacterium]
MSVPARETAPRGGASPPPRPALLVGAGRRPKELGAVLAALGGLRARLDGRGAPEPHRPMGLSDLEELLAQRPPAGTLVLDYERVPGEDVGFVRRFLERHTEWRLVVVGEDVRDRRARALLALPRTQWLPWPPDLDQINALLDLGESSVRSASGARRADSPPPRTLPLASDEEEAPAPRPIPQGRTDEPSAASEENGPVDLGALVEELLAGAALGSGAPRYLFRCDHGILLDRARAPLASGFEGLLQLARVSAGPEGVVSAQVAPSEQAGDPEDAARVRIDFPAAAIPTAILPDLLHKEVPRSKKLPKDLAGAIRAARKAAGALSEAGARVALFQHQDERLRIEVVLASGPVPTQVAPPRAAKAEDPFA